MSTVVIRAPQIFIGPITHKVLIDPVIINCNHVFEKLALTNWFRQNPIHQCPICRHEVTQVFSDTILANLIQNEFVRNCPENARYFERIKRALPDEYPNLFDQPVLPQAANAQIRRPQSFQRHQGFYFQPEAFLKFSCLKEE